VSGLGGGVPATEEETLARYRALVERYHRSLDLMSDRGLAALPAMLADADAYATAVSQHVSAGPVVDVGSGAGLPGVVVALRNRERRVVMVERRRRRAAFLRLVVAQCGLRNAVVLGEDVRRVGVGQAGGHIAAVTAQAVAGMREVYRLTAHLHGERVAMVLRRGGVWAEEVAAFAEALGADVGVVAAEALGRGGTLVVLSVPGGRPCR
jgi:16S rRNA (guanine527-N7)-methyltransferase